MPGRSDLHRIPDLGTVHGLRLILGQAIRMSIDIPPEGAPDDDLSRQDPKQMAARVLICTEN